MIKTIEIAPDIIAKGLARHLYNEFQHFVYMKTKFHLYDPECDVEKLEIIIREYLNK